jgi:hypothetical protein
MSGVGSVYPESGAAPAKNEDLKIRRSPWGDRLIYVREAFLDLVTRSGGDQILNEANDPDALSKEAGIEITAELKRFMDMAKIEAIDEQGLSVDYKNLQASPAYLEYQQSCSPRMRYFDPESLTSREEQIAFWINLYNALIMDGVIANEVTQTVGASSLGLLAFFRKTAYNVGGQRMSCDDIEHGVLRGNRGHPMLPGAQFTSTDPRLAWVVDPREVRVHFALNCASRSCPPIQVYTAEQLDSQLDLAARNFVNSDLEIDPDRGEINLSAIFKWFKGDFGGREGVIDFLIEHLPEDDRKEWLLDHRSTLSFKFKDYDWGLNSSVLH